MKGFKYRLYPTEEQRERIEQTFGCCRLVYNIGLGLKIDAYEQHGIKISSFDLCYQMAEMKQDYDWMRAVDSQALQASIKKIDVAYKHFFNGGGYPKFKKKSNAQSFQCPNNSRKIDFENQLLTIPKIKDIPIRITRKFEGKIKTVTISRTATGKYFASILVDSQDIKCEAKKPVKRAVGIDLGVKTFAVLSDGTEIGNPKFLKKNLERLAVLQRRASRKKKGSKNQKKAYKRVAVLHEKIANQRKDFLHKVSTSIVRKYDTICMEDLSLKNMTKRAKPKQDEAGKFLPNGAAAKSGLSKSLLDAGFGMFREFIEYKSEWSGNNFVKVGRIYASSKTCNNCGHVNNDLTLKDREWDCEICAAKNERDPNAARNIRDEGLRVMFNRTGVGSSEKPVESPTIVGSIKQEVYEKNIYPKG